MRNFQLITCSPGDEAFHLFWNSVTAHYAQGTSIASDLNTDYLHQCLVVLEGENPIARLAMYLNPHIQIDDRPAVLIGNYECINDDVVSTFILEETVRIIRSFGIDRVVGPMNGSTWDHYRFKSTDNTPFLSETQNKPWYIRQFELMDFEVCARYFSARDIHMETHKPEWDIRETELERAGMTLRPIDLKAYEKELKRIYAFNLIAFNANEFYSPISEERFLQKYLPLESLVASDLVLIAENSVGELVGYIFSFMNLLNREEKQIIIKTIARHPDKQWRGLGQAMANRVMSQAKQDGCSSAIHAYLYDGGTSAPVSAKNNGSVIAEYVLFSKAL